MKASFELIPCDTTDYWKILELWIDALRLVKHNEAKGLYLMDTAHLLRSVNGAAFPQLGRGPPPPSRSDQEFSHTAEKLNMCFGRGRLADEGREGCCSEGIRDVICHIRHKNDLSMGTGAACQCRGLWVQQGVP